MGEWEESSLWYRDDTGWCAFGAGLFQTPVSLISSVCFYKRGIKRIYRANDTEVYNLNPSHVHTCESAASLSSDHWGCLYLRLLDQLVLHHFTFAPDTFWTVLPVFLADIDFSEYVVVFMSDSFPSQIVIWNFGLRCLTCLHCEWFILVTDQYNS